MFYLFISPYGPTARQRLPQVLLYVSLLRPGKVGEMRERPDDQWGWSEGAKKNIDDITNHLLLNPSLIPNWGAFSSGEI